MALSRSVDVQDFINERPFGGYQALVLILCFLVLAADGFDTAAIGFIAPALREQWNLGPGQLSVLFVSGLAGLMIGAFVFGPIADRIGRKAILVLTTLGFGVASIVSAAATNVEMLAVLRFVTGLGLGGAMPIAVTLTSEFCPERKRSFLVMIMFCGFTLGGASGGLALSSVASYRSFWQWLFSFFSRNRCATSSSRADRTQRSHLLYVVSILKRHWLIHILSEFIVLSAPRSATCSGATFWQALFYSGSRSS